MSSTSNFARMLAVLQKHGVRYVLIGGLAATVHGSARVTFDLDLCYERSQDNLEALARALQELKATLRGAPTGLPFLLDARTLRAGLNFTFDTTCGPLDTFGEVSGVGAYPAAAEDAVEGRMGGFPVRVLSLGRLIASKKAAGRGRDLDHLRELESIQRARQAQPQAGGRRRRALMRR